MGFSVSSKPIDAKTPSSHCMDPNDARSEDSNDLNASIPTTMSPQLDVRFDDEEIVTNIQRVNGDGTYHYIDGEQLDDDDMNDMNLQLNTLSFIIDGEENDAIPLPIVAPSLSPLIDNEYDLELTRKQIEQKDKTMLEIMMMRIVILMICWMLEMLFLTMMMNVKYYLMMNNYQIYHFYQRMMLMIMMEIGKIITSFFIFFLF